MQQPPYPQPPTSAPPQAPKKKNTLLIVFSVLGAVVLGVCLLCGGALALASLRGGTTTTPGTGSDNTPGTSNGTAKVGDTITVDSVGCTLVSAAVWQSPNQFIKPKAGNQFVRVHVKLHNGSSSEVSYSEFDFHAKSGSGNITDAELTTNDNDLDSGKLAAGGSTEGDIVFQVPKGDHAAQLTWQPSFFGNSDDHAWLLGV